MDIVNWETFETFLTDRGFAKDRKASFLIKWVRKFRQMEFRNPALRPADRREQFVETLHRECSYAEWQIEQTDQAVRFQQLRLLRLALFAQDRAPCVRNPVGRCLRLLQLGKIVGLADDRLGRPVTLVHQVPRRHLARLLQERRKTLS